MTRSENMADKNSCLNRAREDEQIFVLLGRDKSAPAAVLAWCKHRIESGKSLPESKEIVEALLWIERLK